MVAQTPPTRLALDPARVEEFLEDISTVDMSSHDVASKHNTSVGAASVQTCGMSKRPLGHGEASDFAPVPPVRRASGATGALDTAATDNAIASASLRATEIDGSASISVQDDQDALSTSASDSAASMSDFADEPDSHSPHDCFSVSTGEPALHGAHPLPPSQEHLTLKGSSSHHNSDPPLSDPGP